MQFSLVRPVKFDLILFDPAATGEEDLFDGDGDAPDIEDLQRRPLGPKNVSLVHKRKRNEEKNNKEYEEKELLSKSWKEVLGKPPPR